MKYFKLFFTKHLNILNIKYTSWTSKINDQNVQTYHNTVIYSLKKNYGFSINNLYLPTTTLLD